ncbi:MAG: hypothetical protein U1E89_21090 [Burkholderiaceae bacterium]
MLDKLSRWLGGGPDPFKPHGIEHWARAHGARYRRVRHGEGFVVEDQRQGLHWRIEWGASHRPYVNGNELRILAEMGLHRDLQALVLNRALLEHSESMVYEHYIEGVQTSIDTQTPTEIRWLVMYPKLTGAELRTLGARFGAVASVKPWLQQWLDGPLAPALLAAGQRLSEKDPFVLAIARGRLTLRVAMPVPDLDAIGRWLELFVLAARQAKQVAGEWQDSAFAPTSTRASAWPDDARSGPSPA